MKRNLRGVTLIELIVTAAIVAILAAALARAYGSSIDLDTKVRAGRDTLAVRSAFKDRIRDLLSHAYLSSDSTDTTTYFSAPDIAAGGTSRLVFTTLGCQVSREVIDSKDDFETINNTHGPQGGVSEVEISTTPVGNAPDPKGLFLREQRPSDGDSTQGGYESQLSPDIETISFEFWDGQQWQPTWDTLTQTTRRLPASVKVTYRRTGETTDEVFVVQIPASDVTPDNPVTEAGT